MIRLVDRLCVLEGLSDLPEEHTVTLESLPEVAALSLTDEDIEELRLILQQAGGSESRAAA